MQKKIINSLKSILQDDSIQRYLATYHFEPYQAGAEPGIYIWAAGNVYSYIEVDERGEADEVVRTENSEDISYTVCSHISLNEAIKRAMNHGAEDDFRKNMFEEQLELLGQIKVEYKDRRQKEIEQILNEYPY